MATLRKYWNNSPSLTFTAILMTFSLIGCLAGLLIDDRIITGAPAWLKPAKFAISTAVYCGSLAWLYGHLSATTKLTRLANIVSGALIIEILIIDIQALRGTTSHFNLVSNLDSTLFTIMGLGILALWVASVGILRAVWRHKFADAGWGWALRMGMLLTVIGSAAGGLMLKPTTEQTAQQELHQQVTANGGHTVGGLDGGPGLPGVGWSVEHGDLRIPHFLGMHGLQAIPFLAWLFRRHRNLTGLVFAASGSYFALAAILMWQALAGEPLIHPSQTTTMMLSVWLAGSVAAIGAVVARTPAIRQGAAV